MSTFEITEKKIRKITINGPITLETFIEKLNHVPSFFDLVSIGNGFILLEGIE